MASRCWVRMLMRGTLALGLSLGWGLPFVGGQTPTATITGQVRDASGAAVRGARVVARNAETNIEREALTSDEHYRQAGFRALLLEGVPTNGGP